MQHSFVFMANVFFILSYILVSIEVSINVCDVLHDVDSVFCFVKC